MECVDRGGEIFSSSSSIVVMQLLAAVAVIRVYGTSLGGGSSHRLFYLCSHNHPKFQFDAQNQELKSAF